MLLAQLVSLLPVSTDLVDSDLQPTISESTTPPATNDDVFMNVLLSMFFLQGIKRFSLRPFAISLRS